MSLKTNRAVKVLDASPIEARDTQPEVRVRVCISNQGGSEKRTVAKAWLAAI